MTIKTHRMNAREYYEVDGQYFNDYKSAQEHERNIYNKAAQYIINPSSGGQITNWNPGPMVSGQTPLEQENRYLRDKAEFMAKEREALSKRIDDLDQANRALHQGALEEKAAREFSDELAEGLRQQVEVWQADSEESQAEVMKLNRLMGEIRDAVVKLNKHDRPIQVVDDVIPILQRWIKGES